ncbi:MAG TPA: isoleucine--tRNA ligase [Candidatus Acidoferrales bacterium]|nr:isoleucine--tRNA ligase [Candidatus Acidoferrales bacterium]
MSDTIDLKNTVNLPRTAFPMKANLPAAEPRQLAQWEQDRIYERILASRAGAPVYILHDGPPYPTGEIHLGTAENKILKDLVVRSKTLAGFRTPYIPGWDCHGLPIETQVEKELGGKGAVAPAEFRRLCRQFAARYVEAHRREFKRLGIFGQWDDPYLTMDSRFEARIAGAFLAFQEKGYVYRGKKPVYWCLHDRTALAEAEVEYEDRASPSIYVRYEEVGAPPGWKGEERKFYALIWTTTPWTLPASLALAFHPDFEYVLAEDARGDVYILARQLAASVSAATGLEFVRTAGPFPGTVFAAAKFRHPFLERWLPGVLADYITLDQGTGIVHTAPGHGAEDFYTGRKYGLEPYAPLDDSGRFTEGLDDYRGKTVFEANQPIVELLRRRDALVAAATLRHSYPRCWRCHNPVIFRATEQWFIDMEHRHLRRRAIEETERVQWIPAWGRQRMESMVATRPDWCISRQRVWGVPIIAFYCDACGARLEDFTALRHVLTWFEREGADAWFARSAEELLPAGARCSCGAGRWRKEKDILDVWFDSGSTHLAVLDDRDQDHRWPADVYLEGPDQFRGWFQSSLLVGVGVRDAVPYRTVLAHGWALDDKDQPMSKSLGNVVSPRDLCEQWGAELLRLWVASQDYHADVKMSQRVMSQLAEAYRKLRNTFRWALGNLGDFDPALHQVPDAELWELDRWMLGRAAQLIERSRRWYEEFEFHRVFHAVQDFAVIDLSAFYFDVLKDRLYTFAPASPGRRSAQTAVYRIAHALVRLVAPILVFTAEEVWRHLPHRPDDPSSVHMAMLPGPGELAEPLAGDRLAQWERLLAIRADVLKELEAARNRKQIGGSLEAKLVLRAGGTAGELLEKYARWLPALFLVSQVELRHPAAGTAAGDGTGREYSVEVLRADGSKCERCWNYSTQVGACAAYPTVCERCVAALEEIKRAGNGGGVAEARP